MPRQQLKDSLNIKDLLSLTGAVLPNEMYKVDELKPVYNVSSIENSRLGDIIFLTDNKHLSDMSNVGASYCIVSEKNLDKISFKTVPLVANDPYLAFVSIVEYFYGSSEAENDFELINGSWISPKAKIASNAQILPGCVIGANVEIGEGSFIYDNVSIYEADIGKNCIIRSGVRIGGMGFGFVPNYKSGEHKKIPHIARVCIGNQVDIGANTTIDRGFLSDTAIGDNTKIDNLVQIGHGVKIGKSCFIASQVGISGSSEIGDGCWLGGQVGIAGHIKIAAFTQVAAQSGVAESIITANTRVGGSPALPIMTWQKMHFTLKNLVKKRKD
jgi:UDP-3-O-[3-hydroxymyristoyl] glucosamine N-acyltransferase